MIVVIVGKKINSIENNMKEQIYFKAVIRGDKEDTYHSIFAYGKLGLTYKIGKPTKTRRELSKLKLWLPRCSHIISYPNGIFHIGASFTHLLVCKCKNIQLQFVPTNQDYFNIKTVRDISKKVNHSGYMISDILGCDEVTPLDIIPNTFYSCIDSCQFTLKDEATHLLNEWGNKLGLEVLDYKGLKNIADV